MLGGWWHKGREEEEDEEETMAVDAMKIVALLGTYFFFLLLGVFIPLILSQRPPSTKEKRELTFSTGVEEPGKRRNAKHDCHLRAVVFMCLCVCTPLGSWKTVQTSSSQGQTRLRPSVLSHLLPVPLKARCPRLL